MCLKICLRLTVITHMAMNFQVSLDISTSCNPLQYLGHCTSQAKIMSGNLTKMLAANVISSAGVQKFNRPSHQPGMKAKILVGPSQQRQYRCPPLAVQHVQLCSLCQRHCAPHPAITRTLILQPPCCTAYSRTHEPMWCSRFVSFRNCRLMSNIAAIRDIRCRIPPARAPGLPLPHPPPLHVSVSAAVVSPPTQRCS